MKNNENLRKMVRFLMILSLPIAFASCGAYVYYDDGIYGDDRPRKIEVISNKQYSAPERNARNRYADYFHEKASKFDNPTENPSHFTDINSYNSNSYANGETYAGWGQNSSQVTVNVYDNSWHYPYAYGYSPYWRYNDFWGYGAWHYPYRSRVTWGFSMGWGNYYDPHWGWYNRYYGYRPYYYGYYGYDYPYYGRYYSRDYYYNPNASRSSGNYHYGSGRAIIRDNQRRGDSNRYYNYESQRQQGSYYRNEPQRGYHRSDNFARPNNTIQNRNYGNSQPNVPQRGYENRNTERSYERNSNSGNYNSNSGGSYNSNNGGGSYRSSNRR